MKKDIKWVVEQISNAIINPNFDQEGQSDYSESDDAFNQGLVFAVELLDQLDEPETVEQTIRLLENVLKENKRLGKLLEEKHEEWFELMDKINNQETLSEYWIEQKSIDTHVDTLNGEVQVTFRLDDLQNLLVPKQEEVTQEQALRRVAENYPLTPNDIPWVLDRYVANVLIEQPGKTVVPHFVADFIEEVKPDNSLRVAFEYIAQRKRDNHDDNLAFWVEEGNSETFARAWLDGYTVEEEPLYRARLKVITDEFIASYLRTQSSDADDRLKALEIGSKYIHEDYRHLSEFTEDELKRLDIWDSGQWEVEELE